MNLDEAQRKKVAEWIAQGLKLSDIQTRLASELKVTMTYMDVRLLVDDLKLTPKDAERPKAAPSPLAASSPAESAPPETLNPATPAAESQGSVSVSVDQLATPGAMVSGKVTFSDGNQAAWHLDQTGRLGLAPKKLGYRPSAPDLQQFQKALEGELRKIGF